jgi:hypothetical protein
MTQSNIRRTETSKGCEVTGSGSKQGVTVGGKCSAAMVTKSGTTWFPMGGNRAGRCYNLFQGS